jgi:hypothetical protein
MADTLTPLQQRKSAEDALLSELELKLSALDPDARKAYFFENNDAEELNLVNLLSSRVDAIRKPSDRKAFFLAHPELEVRYSFKNFTP